MPTMRRMQIVPVIDLAGGLVVRGVAGRRTEYRPIQSRLAADARPATVARAFVGLGLEEAYLADLDAIAGARPAWDVYRQLHDCGLRLWIDAGLTDVEQARAMTRFAEQSGGASAIIAGSESLPDAAILPDLVHQIGSARFVFSLDLKDGRPIVRAPQWEAESPDTVARAALRSGAKRLLVLDLAAVGSQQGVPTEGLCRKLRAADPHLQLVAGGGVRGMEDLRRLAAAGCDAALVASSLHSGRLGREELAAVNA